MPEHARPWLLVSACAILGIFAGHKLAYGISGAPQDEFHEYLAHLPQIAAIFLALSFIAASFVERGTRVASWPFAAVGVVGFALQEHLERLQHGGAFPFLLDQQTFLVGVLVQCLVGLVTWWFARVLIATFAADCRRVPFASRVSVAILPPGASSDASPVPRGPRSRAPPVGC